jgi:hypothetical protein
MTASIVAEANRRAEQDRVERISIAAKKRHHDAARRRRSADQQ